MNAARPECAALIMRLGLPLHDDASLLPFVHPIRANVWLKVNMVDIGCTRIKHRMASLPKGRARPIPCPVTSRVSSCSYSTR